MGKIPTLKLKYYCTWNHNPRIYFWNCLRYALDSRERNMHPTSIMETNHQQQSWQNIHQKNWTYHQQEISLKSVCHQAINSLKNQGPSMLQKGCLNSGFTDRHLVFFRLSTVPLEELCEHPGSFIDHWRHRNRYEWNHETQQCSCLHLCWPSCPSKCSNLSSKDSWWACGPTIPQRKSEYSE